MILLYVNLKNHQRTCSTNIFSFSLQLNNKKFVFSRILPVYFVRVSLFLVSLFDVCQFSVQLLTAKKIYQGFSRTKDPNHKCFQSQNCWKRDIFTPKQIQSFLKKKNLEFTYFKRLIFKHVLKKMTLFRNALSCLLCRIKHLNKNIKKKKKKYQQHVSCC